MIDSFISFPVIKDIFIGISQCIAIFTTLFLFPIIGAFAVLLLPLPILFYRLKLGCQKGLVMAAITFIILIIMTGRLGFDLLYCGELLCMGLMIGECIERQMRIEKIMITTSIVIFSTAIICLMVYAAIEGQTIQKIFSDYKSYYFTISSQLYKDMGIEKTQIAMLNSVLVKILPGIFIVSLIFTMWVNILIIKKLLINREIFLDSLKNLNLYQAPHYLVWFVILFGVSLILLPIENLQYFNINCLIILTLIYFFQGIAVVSFFFQKKKFPPFVTICCYSIISMQIYLLLLIVGLGFFDNWINFRKIKIENNIQI